MSHRGRGQSQLRGRGDSQSPSRGGSGNISRGRGGGGSGFGGDRGRGAGFDGGRGRGRRGFSPGPGGPSQYGSGGGGEPNIFASDTPATIDPRLSSANLNRLINSFKAISPSNNDPKRPLRPGFGILGREITLRANFFPLRLSNKVIYDYTVQITPPRTSRTGGGGSKRGGSGGEIGVADSGANTKRRLFQLLEKHPNFNPFLPHTAHDHTQRIVSAQPLPQPLDIPVTFYEVGETGPPKKGAKVYTISIVFTRELDMTILTNYQSGDPAFRDTDISTLISAFNLIIQSHPSRTGAVRVGRNRYFFPTHEDIRSLSPGVDAWKGFFSSVRPAFNQLLVNVNVCMTAFYRPGNLAERLIEFQRASSGGMMNDFKQSLKVVTRHLGYSRRKAVKAITDKTATKSTFDCPEFGGRITVEQYFRKKYNITLQHPDTLPVIEIGNKDRSVLVPAELCWIEEGTPYFAKLNDTETANMIRYACNRPRVNAESIVNQGLPRLGLSSHSNPPRPLTHFGIEVDSNMLVVPARELPAPTVTYKPVPGSRPPDVRNGSWNILDVKFKRGAQISSWWVLVIRDGRKMAVSGPKDPGLVSLVQNFASKCAKSGMGMPGGMPKLLVTPELPPIRDDQARARALTMIRRTLEDNLRAGPGGANVRKPSFVLVLLSERDNYIYPGIKRIGDVVLGLHTVHMQLSKALNEAKQDQYLSNVAIKVNTKLGGVNHTLDVGAMQWLTVKRTMVVGMDVTHPRGTNKAGTPSIAAVVASIDADFVHFPASMRIQIGREEMIQELTDMMTERLLLFEKKNKGLPDKIIVYRDGVSEGQYDDVINEELPKIQDAFKKFNTAQRKSQYQPKLTIVICGKRHHARFYPTTSANADRNGNTRPGTVLDKGITAIYEFDWYLQAHAGLQGTVRPTHYIVVYDENNMGADELQQGTHTASYLYGRATKAVSLVPAAYYADLACERGRCYLNDLLLVDDKTSSGKTKRDKDEESVRVFENAKRMWGEGIHPDLRESMFYL